MCFLQHTEQFLRHSSDCVMIVDVYHVFPSPPACFRRHKYPSCASPLSQSSRHILNNNPLLSTQINNKTPSQYSGYYQQHPLSILRILSTTPLLHTQITNNNTPSQIKYIIQSSGHCRRSARRNEQRMSYLPRRPKTGQQSLQIELWSFVS